MGRRTGRILGAALALLLTADAAAQTPDARWRTIETEHYRLHYPLEAAPWAQAIAADLEGIRAAVSAEVGYAPERVVDIVIRDPFATANGMALPFTRRPRMELWATPPEATSVIGHYDRWHRLLAVHEDTHLVHLMRPARNPGERLLQGLIGIGPVAWKSPRWVAEGYATVVEGRLTGFGRPNGDFRATFLRTLAREGRLPTYAELDGSPRFAGGAYAYLVGSAFLEWLDARAGGDSLPKLWARMSAIEIRSFEDAFEGLYGDDPVALYGRFTAELTRDALALEKGLTEEETPWLRVDGATSVPAFDAARFRVIATVQRGEGPNEIVVWNLAIDDEAVADWEEDLAEAAEADPADTADRRPVDLGRDEVARRSRRSPAASDPRPMPDGRVLFTGWKVDPRGRGRTDLYAWEPDTGRERRLTRGADLREADPSPDGTFAVAVRTTFGTHELVRVDLESGVWTTILDGGVEVLFGAPRLTPDGAAAIVSVHRGAGWTLEYVDLRSGEARPLALPEGAVATLASVDADGAAVTASVGRAGLVEAWSLPIDGSPGSPIAAPPGGALGPIRLPDGDLLYATLHSDGFELRTASAAPTEPLSANTSLATRPEPPDAPSAIAMVAPPAARPYGLGRIQTRLLVDTAASAGAAASSVGVRIGDLVGRNELLALGTFGSGDGADALSVAWENRSLPLTLRAHGYAAREHLASGSDRAGLALSAGLDRSLPNGRWTLAGTGLFDVPVADDPDSARLVAGLRAELAVAEPRRRLARASLRLSPALGNTGAGLWWRADGAARLELGRTWGLALDGAGGLTTATAAVDRYRLGGLNPSALPDLYVAPRVESGALAPGLATGGAYVRARVEIGGPAHLFAERFHVLDGGATATATTAGFAVRGELPAVPLAGTPGASFDTGLACRLETPGRGWIAAPCTVLGDWTLWAQLRYRVGGPR